MLNSGLIISDPDLIAMIRLGGGEGRGHSGTKSMGYAVCGIESRKFLTLFVLDLGLHTAVAQLVEHCSANGHGFESF